MYRLLLITAAALALTATSNLRAGHVYGGVIDTDSTPGLNPGDALAFVNQTTGVAITGSSLGILAMSLVTTPGEATTGLFLSSAPSFTALSNGLSWTGSAYRAANPFAAGSGSLLQLRIESITGPAGATFSFWDTAVSTTEPAEFYTIGSSGPTESWNLTDLNLNVGDGVTPNPTGINNPPVDPYGHLHGRSFTVDTPGEYTVNFILSDANGHYAESAPFTLTYSAIPEPGTALMLLLGAGATVLALRRRRS